MPKQALLNKIEHTLSASIRNFQVAEGLLTGTDPDKDLGAELLRASIAQIKALKDEISDTIPQE